MAIAVVLIKAIYAQRSTVIWAHKVAVLTYNGRAGSQILVADRAGLMFVSRGGLSRRPRLVLRIAGRGSRPRRCRSLSSGGRAHASRPGSRGSPLLAAGRCRGSAGWLTMGYLANLHMREVYHILHGVSHKVSRATSTSVSSCPRKRMCQRALSGIYPMTVPTRPLYSRRPVRPTTVTWLMPGFNHHWPASRSDGGCSASSGMPSWKAGSARPPDPPGGGGGGVGAPGVGPPGGAGGGHGFHAFPRIGLPALGDLGGTVGGAL